MECEGSLAREFYIPGYNDMYFVESLQMFRRNVSFPSSGAKNKPSKKIK
jgi:hypothetical protein